jgi:hypothetical protein
LCPGSEKDITEVSGTSSPGSTPGRGTQFAKEPLKLRGFFNHPRPTAKFFYSGRLFGGKWAKMKVGSAPAFVALAKSFEYPQTVPEGG